MNTTSAISKNIKDNNFIGKVITIPDKYVGTRICVVQCISEDEKILFAKDVFGNKYEFDINDVSFVN